MITAILDHYCNQDRITNSRGKAVIRSTLESPKSQDRLSKHDDSKPTYCHCHDYAEIADSAFELVAHTMDIPYKRRLAFGVYFAA